jgi:hypothetical protein
MDLFPVIRAGSRPRCIEIRNGIGHANSVDRATSRHSELGDSLFYGIFKIQEGHTALGYWTRG